jgi:Alpha/beta hydrolase domain
MAAPSKRSRFTLLPCVLVATASLLLWLAPVAAAERRETSDPQVQASSVQPLGSGYLQVEGAMSGNISRDDGSQGHYRVPVTLVYPEDAARCSGEALVDAINSVFYETFAFAGTRQDPFFPSLLPGARLLLGDNFMQSRGYVYAHAQWNKLVIERQREAGTLPDPTLAIERGTDGYPILRDLSDFLRRPAELFVGPVAPPCAVQDVVAFGGSQTAMLLRQFYFAGLNTALTSGSSFDDGKVFEGSLQFVPGGRCRSLTDDSPWFAYSFAHCEGETPAAQGKVITINAETDVQLINGWRARPDGDGAIAYYRLYEVAGVSHIPTPFIPLKLVGLRNAGAAEQNYAEMAPVLRAMADQLREWIEGESEPSPSIFLKGRVARLAAPLFSTASWGSDNALAFVTRLGEDGNALGGVRLPHVRTTLPNGVRVGAPLGLYRGTECGTDATESTYILTCGISGDPNIYNMAGGIFTPYPQVDPRLCSAFYPTNQSYTDAIIDAAEHAVAQGWILAEEIDSIVAAAERKALEYPGCVPGVG